MLNAAADQERIRKEKERRKAKREQHVRLLTSLPDSSPLL